MTVQEKLVAALLDLGHGPIEVRSGYVYVLEVRRDGKPSKGKFIVGPSGALRFGKSRTNSTSMTDGPAYKRLVAKGEELLATPALTKPIVNADFADL